MALRFGSLCKRNESSSTWRWFLPEAMDRNLVNIWPGVTNGVFDQLSWRKGLPELAPYLRA
jgi:hypothetical protein